MPLNLTVLSPQKKILETECLSVSLPALNGQITILPRHIPLFTQLGSGEVKVKTTSSPDTLIAVSGGFANINNNQVVILAEFGVVSDQIDATQVQLAKERAEEILQNVSDEKSSALAQADLSRSILQLKVLKKNRRL